MRCDVCGLPITGAYWYHNRLDARIHERCPLTNVKGEDVTGHAMTYHPKPR